VRITRQKSPVFSIVSLPTDSVIVDHAVEREDISWRRYLREIKKIRQEGRPFLLQDTWLLEMIDFCLHFTNYIDCPARDWLT
jgi:hypothetical protein